MAEFPSDPRAACPPEPLEAGWLAAYANLSDEDAAMLLEREDAGESIESAFKVKRAGPWSSLFHLTDQRLMEREYRFYNEIAVIVALAEMRSCKQHAVASSSKNPFQALDALSFRPVHNVLSKSTSLPQLVNPQHATKFVGAVHDFTEFRSNGIDGRYEVMRPRVSIYTAPSPKASLLGVLHRYSFVRGSAFTAEDGEPWLLLHSDTMEDIKINREGAFVPITGKGMGCGDLLKRSSGHPGPTRHGWRASVAEEEKALVPKFERWRRFIQRLTVRSLRLPRCLASVCKKHWSSFLLLLEQLSWPEWSCADPIGGLTEGEAAGAVIGLAGLHNTFAAEGKLSALPWLPTLPLHGESAAHMQCIYKEVFHQCREELTVLMSPSAFDVCWKLGNGYYPQVMCHLSKPPLTLLHGCFVPAALRFSTSTHPPTVAAYDWQFVCRGRGAYDFALFLTLCAPPEVRRDCQLDLIMRYLMARGMTTRVMRREFLEDFRFALLLAFSFFLMNMASALKAETGDSAYQAKRGIYCFSEIIDDWDCSDCVGGTDVAKKPKRKRAYKKKSRRKPNSRASSPAGTTRTSSPGAKRTSSPEAGAKRTSSPGAKRTSTSKAGGKRASTSSAGGKRASFVDAKN